MKRYDYIDNLKGIAIFLVVVGHNLAWNIDDFDTFISCGRRTDMFWFHLIYAFHMPLFFWISGFLLPKDNLNLQDLPCIIWRRTYTLLIPFLCAGYVMDALSHTHCGGGNLWFLIALYELLLIALIYEAISRICHLGIKSIIVYYFGMFVLIQILFGIYGDTSIGKYLHLESIANINNYSGFVFGVICRKYYKLVKILESNIAYTICLILFILLLSISFNQQQHNKFLLQMTLMIPLCGIVCMIYLTKNCISQNSFYARALNYLGKHSLEIYIIHFFFNFRLFMISDYAISMIHSSSYRDVFWGHTCMLVSSIVFSAIMIALSLLTMHVFRASNFLSILLLGRKN